MFAVLWFDFWSVAFLLFGFEIMCWELLIILKETLQIFWDLIIFLRKMLSPNGFSLITLPLFLESISFIVFFIFCLLWASFALLRCSFRFLLFLKHLLNKMVFFSRCFIFQGFIITHWIILIRMSYRIYKLLNFGFGIFWLSIFLFLSNWSLSINLI